MMQHNTDLDWTGFTKLRNENDIIEAAKCNKCHQIIQFFSERQFQKHREKTCKKRPLEESDVNLEDYDELDDQDKINILHKDLVKFFISANVAFKQVENPFFLKFVKRLYKFQVNYKPPSRSTMTSVSLQSLYEDIQENKQKILKNTDSILLVDKWINKSNNAKYIIFSLKNINTTRAFLNHINMSDSEESEYSEDLSKYISQAIQFANDTYESKVFAVVTNNDEEMIEAVQMVLNTDNNDHLLQSTCANDCGNILFRSLVEKNFVKSVKEVLDAFKVPELEALLLEKGGFKLQEFSETQFFHFWETCQTILKNIGFIQEICASGVDVSSTILKNVFNANFKRQLTRIVVTLHPLYNLIGNFKNSELNIADAVQSWLSLKFPTDKDNDKITTEIGKFLGGLALAANLMHHKYKGQLLDANQKLEAKEFLEGYLDKDSRRELNDYLDSNNEYSRYAEGCQDPVAYWTLVGLTLPNLSKDMKKLMLIPASTCLVENLFSGWLYINDVYNNHLGDMSSPYLMDIYLSLKFENFEKFEIIKGKIYLC